jgi:hypothetical protein
MAVNIESKEPTMAEEIDEKKLEAKIKELTKRADELGASADKLQEAAKDVESASKAQAKDASSVKQRK